MQKKNQPFVVLGIVGVIVLTLLSVALLGSSGINLGGTVIKVESPDFPSLEAIRTDPDTTNTRAVNVKWEPITVAAVTTPVCENWLIYHSNKAGSWGIYRLDDLASQTPKVRSISNDPSGKNSVSPSRSPDGKWVAFSSDRDGNWEIYVANADSGTLQRMTFNTWATEVNPVWSPNGKQLVYESIRNGNWDLYTMDVVTGEEGRLTTSPGSDINAFWSPDSSKILFQSNRDGITQIYEIDMASKVDRKVSQGQAEDTDPAYGPDGSRMIYLSKSPTTGNAIVTIAGVDGSNPVQISDETRNAAGMVWSKDGGRIVFQTESADKSTSDLVLYEVETGLSRDLTANSGRNYAPTWICDSSDVAFTSTAKETAQIFTISAKWLDDPEAKPFDVKVSPNVTQLTTGDARSEYPQNSPAIERGSRRALLAKAPRR